MEHLLGLLNIHVHRGVNLAVRDVTSSDPYVVLKMGKQAYYLPVPLPVEKAPTRRVATKMRLKKSGVIVSELHNYPVYGLVFEGGNMVQDLSDAVASSCIFLQNNNIPCNVLISDCGERIFLFPQCFAEKQAVGEVSQEVLDTQVNPAVWEISGHIVLKRKEDFEHASEVSAWRLLADVSLSRERFQDVKSFLLVDRDINDQDWTNSMKPPTSQPALCFPQDCLVHQLEEIFSLFSSFDPYREVEKICERAAWWVMITY